MFRSKMDVDRHVRDIFSKLQNETEKSLRGYNIAKLYYQVGDFESAKRYVSNYLEMRESSAGAHKLLGQTLEALGQKEAALAHYKTSLELDARQDDLVLKVCELLVDMDISMDVNKVRYWVNRADKLFPHNPIVFQLKEKLLSTERPNDNNEDLEALIASELSARPTDVHLRVKLLKHYIAKQRLDDAYNHAATVEATHSHRNSIVWYQSLSELLTKCKESKQSDWFFWVLYISSLERYTALSLKEQGNEVVKTVPEATQTVFNFDQSLTEFKTFVTNQIFVTNRAFTDHMLTHMWGQLHYHLACLFLRKSKREQGIWSEAGRLCAPLLLCALDTAPIDPSAAWATHIKDQWLKSQIQLWYREGSYRCSQAGHVLQDYGRDDAKKLMDKIDKFCTGSWRNRVFQRIFVSRIHHQLIGTSYFTSITTNPSLRLCSHNELKRYDEVSEEVWPDSLHHQIWLGTKSRPSQNKGGGPHPNQISHIFPELQFSVYNLSQAAPDSLSRLDIDAFLNAATFCATAVIEEQQLSGLLNPERLPTLPADLTTALCTCAQQKWWSCAYKMYSKPDVLEGDIGEIRQELQRGLEVVRCIDNHRLHPALLVHLARIFHYRAKVLKEKDKDHSDISALEARSELYWSNAVPLLEKLQNNQTIRMGNAKLFNYQGKEMNNSELTNALEEGRLLLAQRLVRDKQYEQAIEALQALKCPEASFQQGQIYKTLADEIVSSMPRESVTSEMRSQHIIMLSKARDCLYLTLDRLRSPGTNPKHPLNSELCTHIADIENELKRIDPDLPRGDMSRNECDGLSDESYSSAHSGVDQPITNATLTGLTTSVNMLSTPQRNTHRTPKQSSTPCRPQNQDILDLSRNRMEARPSPERLDAQLRQMIHWRDNVMQTVLEQNKAVLESNKAMMEKIEELVKEIAELRKDNQRQRTQSVNANTNLEEDLYVIGEDDYNDLNYNANQAGAQSSISGNMFPSSHRHPYSPLVYPAATAFQGYYQGGIPFSDPNTQPIPSLYPPNLYPMSVVYPNRTKMPETMLPHGLFRLPTQLDLIQPTNEPMQMQMPMQKPEVPKVETTIKDAPVNKVPPVNVVITTSDTLPTTAPAAQPTLSVIIPSQYRAANNTTLTNVEQPNAPHCFQIPMPSQATIPTTVNLPSSTTLTTTPANISTPEPAKISANVRPAESPNSSAEVCEQEDDPIPDFVPVIPLPAEVPVTTGEEDEETLYCARAKLYRFVNKEWKERGVGNVKLLKNAEGKVRLLMRRDQVLKVCANHMLRPDMELTPMPNYDKAWIWVANDFADEEVKLENLCIKFKTTEEAQAFKEHFDKARASLVPSPQKPDKVVGKTDKVEPAKQSKPGEQLTFGKLATQEKPIEGVAGLENLSLDNSKSSGTTAVVGGFSFTSKPIIQKVSSTEGVKTSKPEETQKVSPFAGLVFNQKPATTTPSTTSTFQRGTLGGIFSVGKTTSSMTTFTTPPPGTTMASHPVAANANENVSGVHSSLLKPYTASGAGGVSSTVGIQDPETQSMQSKHEEVLFQGKVTLQYYNSDSKQWENRGKGQIKLLCNTKSGKVRLLMTDDESSKVCYNYGVLANTSFTLKTGANCIVNWSIQYGKENKTGMFSATFKTSEQASQFYNTLLNNQQKMVKDCVPIESTKKQESQKVQANKQQPSLAEMFKPPPGSWECKECYTRNSSTDVKCLACCGPRPGATPSAAASAPTATTTATTATNQIPLSQLFKPPANTWECKACYVHNSGSNSYCVACDSPKEPGMPPKPKTNSFQLGIQPSGPTPPFSFGIPSESSGLSSWMSSSNEKSAADSAKTKSSNATPKSDGTKLVFGTPQRPSTPPNKDTPFTFGSPGKSFGFNFIAKSPAKSPGGGENSEDEVVESDDIHFSPLIPLPDKVDVKTGEEDEEVLYSHRAKLFRYDSSVKEWKERGVGDIKILRHKETGKLRMIMRRDQILKLCLNHFILPDLEVTAKDEKTWLWNAADYSEGKTEYTNFACRFKTAEVAEEFKQALDDARNNITPSFRRDSNKSSDEQAKGSSQDIEILYEAKVTPEEKAAALKLKLPENFFAYKQKPDCPGCRGCRSPSVPLFDSDKPKTTVESKVSTVSTTSTPISSIHFTPPANTNTVNDVKPLGPATDLSTTTSNAPSTMYKTGFSLGNTATQFKPSLLSASSTDKPAMSFGNSDFNTFNDKKTTAFSFGIPQTQFGTTDTQQKSESTEKQGSTLLENLKICSPQTQVTSTTMSASTGQSSFTVTPPTSIFKGTGTKENPFSVDSGSKNIFGGKPKKGGYSVVIKPSTLNVSTGNTETVFPNNFGTQSKTTANATTTTTTTTFSGFPILGAAKPSSTEAANSAGGFSITSNSSAPSVFEMPNKSTAPVFGPSMLFSFGNSNNTAAPQTKPVDNMPKKEEAIVFGPKSEVTFSTLAAKAPQLEAFKIDPNFAFADAGSFVFGAKPAGSLNSSTRDGKKTNDKDDDQEGDENENDQEHDPQFEPIIPLPDAIEVRTGEEEEEKVFCERAKLFRYMSSTREWKERGVGEMKILHHKGHGTYRLLLRRDQVYKVVCNFLLTPDVAFHRLQSSDSTWIWAGMNHAEDKPCIEELAVRFKTSQLAMQFKETIDKIQQSLRENRHKKLENAQEDQDEENDEVEEEEEDEDEDDEEDDEDEEAEDEDEDDDEIDDKEEEDDEDCQKIVMFEERATLFARSSDEEEWEHLATGTLIIYHDPYVYNEQIVLKADDSDKIVSETVAGNTTIEVEGKECTWRAIDYALHPSTARSLKAVFSTVEAAEQMCNLNLPSECKVDQENLE